MKPYRRYRLRRVYGTDEWVVVALDWTPRGWRRNEPECYYTDDLDDALATMADMIEREGADR
jgi:hypothetical protein